MSPAPSLHLCPLPPGSLSPRPVPVQPGPREVLLNDQSDNGGTDTCLVCPWAAGPPQAQECQGLGLKQASVPGSQGFGFFLDSALEKAGGSTGLWQGRGRTRSGPSPQLLAENLGKPPPRSKPQSAHPKRGLATPTLHSDCEDCE